MDRSPFPAVSLPTQSQASLAGGKYTDGHCSVDGSPTDKWLSLTLCFISFLPLSRPHLRWGLLDLGPYEIIPTSEWCIPEQRKVNIKAYCPIYTWGCRWYFNRVCLWQ